MTMTANFAFDAAAVTSSSDLFGGDLFGDELMDMYNSAAVVGSSDGIEAIAEIPTLGEHPTTESKPASSAPAASTDAAHPGAQVAMAAAAMDDGLGAFRPSTSFSDFGALMPDDAAAGAKAGAAASSSGAAVVSAAAIAGGVTSPSPVKTEAGKPKKRSRANAAAASAAGKEAGAAPSPKKRKSAAGGGSRRASSAKATPDASVVHPVSPTSAKTVAPAKKTGKAGDKNTPNPLAIPNMPSGPAGKAATVITPKAALTAKTAAPPAAAGVKSAASTAATGVRHVVAPKGAVATAAAAAAAAKAAAHPSMMSPAAAAAKAAVTKPTAPAPGTVSSSAVPVQVTSTSVAAVKQETTEDDFKGVAQAAVTNLIMTVGAKAGQTTTKKVTTAGGASAAASKEVDTSSAHIAALTSSNWVAACSESIGDAPPGTQQAAQAAALAAAAASSDPAASKAARARRANLTPDERARQNRDRNREHARNTRLRKKAYVEELKKTLTELVAQRDAVDLEKRHEAQRDLEVREVRFRVMEEFLKLRSQGGNAALLSRWVAIMEEGFTLTLPRTEYRAMVPRSGMSRAVSIDNTVSTVAPSPAEQVLKGASEAMEDASNLASFVNTIGSGGHVIGAANANAPIRFAHHCDRKKFMMDGVNAMLEFTASTSGAVSRGAPTELFVKGTMRATFSPASNKLVCAELLFDTGSVASQAKNLVAAPAVVVTTAQLHPVPEASAATAAQVAASEADALLDSIQMPQIATGTTPGMSAVLSATSLDGSPESSNVSVSSSEKGESSSDESIDGANKTTAGEGSIATRRSTRVQ